MNLQRHGLPLLTSLVPDFMKQKFSACLLIPCFSLLLLLINTPCSWSQPAPQQRDSLKPGLSAAAVFLSKYVRIPSVSGNEKEAAAFMSGECRQKGLFVSQITDRPASYNFAASLFPLSLNKPNIIFLNHLDVVPPGDSSNWKYPPFGGKIAEGKVWGRGSFDNKGLAAIQLFSMLKFADSSGKKDLPYNVTLLCVSGEETGGQLGSALVAGDFQSVFNPAVVIGEGGSGLEKVSFLPRAGTYFGISVAEKSFLWLKVECLLSGSGHSAVAGSEYADKRLVNGLHRLMEARQPVRIIPLTKRMFSDIGHKIGGLRGFVCCHIQWKLFRPFLQKYTAGNPELKSILCNMVTVTSLSGSSESPNQNAQEASAVLDCRYLPGTSSGEMLRFVNKNLHDTLLKVSIIRSGDRPLITRPEYFYEQLCKALRCVYRGSEIAPILFPATNDNSYYRSSGCPVYGLNPLIVSSAQIEAVHNYNEFIDLEDIDKGVEVYFRFLHSVMFPEPAAVNGSANPQ